MKVLSASFNSRVAVVAMALATVTAGAAPVFAWGAGAPDSAYSVSYDSPHSTLVRARSGERARAYYNYAGHRRVAQDPQKYRGNAPTDTGIPAGGWW